MAQNLTDNRQIDKILTDNWHLQPPIQTLTYNVKGYLNPRWRLVTTIDLRSKSCMCCILETKNFAADLSLQIFKNH